MSKSRKSNLKKVLIALGGAAFLAGCVQPQRFEPDYPPPPPRKQADAKTQLESGRKY